jgi:metallophosphoesterase (TIGR00282 family)
MRILFIGDIFGKPGRAIAKLAVPSIRIGEKVDLVVANAENAAGGNGLTAKTADELYSAEIDCLTSGNHHWDKKEILSYDPEKTGRLLRPLNYPPDTPGVGSTIVKVGAGETCGVISLVGRLFMKAVDCPFRVAEEEVENMARGTSIIIVDFHAEATSEKQALANFMDGKVSAVIGTHTHVQTADERILPKGTAYITDVGMTGPFDSVIGVKKEQAINRFVSQIPGRFEVAKGDVRLQAVILDVDSGGRAESIRRLQIRMEEVGNAGGTD